MTIKPKSFNTVHGKVSLLLLLAIICNGTLILFSYYYLQYEADINGTDIEVSLSNENGLVAFSNTTTVWMAGIIFDVLKIQPQIWESIVDINCNHGIGIHIISRENIDRGTEKRNKLVSGFNDCAPFELHDENDLNIQANEIGTNRIDRISYLRDYQRLMLVQNQFANRWDKGIVILVDLDLLQLPSSALILNQIEQMNDDSYPSDAICAIGSSINLNSAEGKKKRTMIPLYYDTYATVFLPDTFSHPLSRRLIPHFYEGEDPKLVRSNDQLHGNFTQHDMWTYFVEQGLQNDTGNVPVKSCFGGFTMYRSEKYFNDECNYTLSKDFIETHKSDQTSVMRYANNKEERPCEHVVFHDCLKNSKRLFEISLNPKLVTIWRRDA